MSQCVICTRTNRDGAACKLCTDTLVKDFLVLAWLDTEMLVTRTRQARVGGGGRGSGSPLVFHSGAADAGDRLYQDIARAARMWGERHPGDWPPDMPAAGLCRWFAARSTEVRGYEGVKALRDLVDRHTERALLVINRPPDLSTYGVCGAPVGDDGLSCTAYLYGEPDAGWVRCSRCQAQHNTVERRQVLRAKMAELYFRAGTLARLLPLVIDRPVSASGIRNWVARGKPIRVVIDKDEIPTYRCRDVIDVALTTPERDRKKAS